MRMAGDCKAEEAILNNGPCWNCVSLNKRTYIRRGQSDQTDLAVWTVLAEVHTDNS